MAFSEVVTTTEALTSNGSPAGWQTRGSATVRLTDPELETGGPNWTHTTPSRIGAPSGTGAGTTPMRPPKVPVPSKRVGPLQATRGGAIEAPSSTFDETVTSVPQPVAVAVTTTTGTCSTGPGTSTCQVRPAASQVIGVSTPSTVAVIPTTSGPRRAAGSDTLPAPAPTPSTAHERVVESAFGSMRCEPTGTIEAERSA